MRVDATLAQDPGVRIRPLAPAAEAALLHRWFTLPYAHFWGMQDSTEAEVRRFYAEMQDSGHAGAFLGLVDGRAAFLLECYDPRRDELGRHYAVKAGDLGMHFFVGPPDAPVPGFTRRVFRSIMHFMFDHLGARRIVVEPDVRNDKVHVLNRAMGFTYDREVQLPHKRAALAFCTTAQFAAAQPGTSPAAGPRSATESASFSDTPSKETAS